MANQNGNYGFRSVAKLGSGYNSGGMTEYKIGNNEGSAIYQGDPVVLVANGAIDVGSTAGAEILGIFNGCEYTDPTTGKPTWSNYYPGSIAADDIKAYVIDDPNALFEVKVDDTNAGQAQVGTNCNIATYSAGSTINGISNVAIDGDSFTTDAGANFRVVGLSKDDQNNDYTAANSAVIVKINLHSLTDTTGIQEVN